MPKIQEVGNAALVLVVDDFADAREMYAEFLEFLGYRVALASDGYEAIDRARSLHPDVILMDFSMPTLDGLATTRVLKLDPATASIPIVLATGEAADRWKDAALAAGCCAFLTKPVLPSEVATTLERALADRTAPITLPRPRSASGT